jgi:hypothetical protein
LDLVDAVTKHKSTATKICASDLEPPMDGAAATWMKQIAESATVYVTKAAFMVTRHGSQILLSKGVVLDKAIQKLNKVSGGDHTESGKVWHEGLAQNCTFEALSAHARETLMKAKSKTVASLRANTEQEPSDCVPLLEIFSFVFQNCVPTVLLLRRGACPARELTPLASVSSGALASSNDVCRFAQHGPNLHSGSVGVQLDIGPRR